MADGSTAVPVKDPGDWKTVDPGDWKDVDAPQSFGDHLANIASNYWEQINPAKMLRGAAEGAAHPINTAKSYGARNAELFEKAKQSYQRGDYAGAVSHSLHYLLNGIPGVGSTLDEASEQARGGDIPGALAKTAGLATTLIGGPKSPGAVAAVAERAPQALTRVVESPALQGLKAALPEIPIVPRKIGDVARPFSKGWTAYRDAQAARAVEEIPTIAAPGENPAIPAIPGAPESPGLRAPLRPPIGATPNGAAIAPESPGLRAPLRPPLQQPKAAAAAPAEPAPDFEGMGRTKKATALAHILDQSGISAEDIALLPLKQQTEHLGALVKELKINKTGHISADAISETLFELRKLQRAQAAQ